MNVIEGINRLIALFIEVFKQVGRGRIWLWLLLYFILQWLILEAHSEFPLPFLYGLISFWTGLFGEQVATGFRHYPGHFLLLPFFFEWARLIFGLIVEGLILGAVSLLFYESFVSVPREDRFRFRELLPRWIHLVLAYVVLNGILMGLGFMLPDLMEGVLDHSPRRIAFFEWVLLPSLYAVVVALLLAVVPSIVIYRDNIFQALGRSLRLFIHNPMTCLVISGIVLAGPVVIANISSNPARIVDNFKPELVYWVLVVGLVIDMFVHFVWMGAAVRLLLAEEE
ncbi:MAG: hypothetical protein DRP47_08025 [Candidatus Zixiibacteriota bacterium]|nr:MAG: hypothetical protein DRP47_08025 [candidate division Zixibacteria bacterium]